MNLSTKKQLIEKASELGTQAYNEGKSCIPVQDKNLMDLIKNRRTQIGTKVGSSTFIFKAWSDAWLKAHSESTKNVMMDIELQPTTSILPIVLVQTQNNLAQK